MSSYPGALLAEPCKFFNKSGQPYKVFTPFWKSLLAKIDESEIPTLASTWRQKAFVAPETALDPLQLLSGRAWEQTMLSAWHVGETAAQNNLDQFIATDLPDYNERRDIPSLPATSRLSPHLCFGEISPRRVWQQLRERLNSHDFVDQEKSVWAWLRQLAWREFAYHLLFHFPASTESALNERFQQMCWAHDEENFLLWQRGQTGYPIVDAGMRQLWETGWMHNRVRMVAASFLTKHLGVHWLHGAQWFWDTLVDADLANNTLGWQWVAGCGADASPYYRIFNPTLQSRKFDPKGRYIRHWLPQLRDASDQEIHEPYATSIAGQVDYPRPCVNHREARVAALARYQEMREA